MRDVLSVKGLHDHAKFERLFCYCDQTNGTTLYKGPHLLQPYPVSHPPSSCKLTTPTSPIAGHMLGDHTHLPVACPYLVPLHGDHRSGRSLGGYELLQSSHRHASAKHSSDRGEARVFPTERRRGGKEGGEVRREGGVRVKCTRVHT